MPDAIQLVRSVRIDPNKIGPDERILLHLDDCSTWVVEVRDGGLYVDPEMNSQFDRASRDAAESVAADWRARSEAYRAARPKQQHNPPLEMDPEVLKTSGHNRCHVIIGSNRGTELNVGDDVALEFWYLEPVIHIGHAPLGAKLRSVALTTRVGGRELVA